MAKITEDKIYIISFDRPIDQKDIESFIELVISNCKKNNVLIDISKNCSCELGFELSITDVSYTYIKDNNNDFYYQLFLQYHNARQLRFVEDNNDNKIGLRFKDNIKSFNDTELNDLVNMINLTLTS